MKMREIIDIVNQYPYSLDCCGKITSYRFKSYIEAYIYFIKDLLPKIFPDYIYSLRVFDTEYFLDGINPSFVNSYQKSITQNGLVFKYQNDKVYKYCKIIKIDNQLEKHFIYMPDKTIISVFSYKIYDTYAYYKLHLNKYSIIKNSIGNYNIYNNSSNLNLQCNNIDEAYNLLLTYLKKKYLERGFSHFYTIVAEFGKSRKVEKW
jgi:hypothetical protein